MSTEESYHQAQRFGWSTSWYEDGNKKAEGKYHMNYKQGVWTYWDEEGNETSEEFDDWGYPK